MPKELTSGTRLDQFRAKISRRPEAVRILTEGDSWFAFPLPSRPNIPDHLITAFAGKAAWLRLESIGDEVVEMLVGDQRNRLRKLLADEDLNFEALLFSGGGNDLVGENLAPLLNDFRPGMEWRDCINLPAFWRRLGQLEDAYLTLIELRDELRPQCKLFVHAYDFAVPDGRPVRVKFLFEILTLGPWMRPAFERRGIRDAVMQRQVIRYLLEQFGELMAKLDQTEFDNVIYVRTQGTLADGDWGDELHPTRAGFAKLAGKFQAALEKEFPDRL